MSQAADRVDIERLPESTVVTLTSRLNRPAHRTASKPSVATDQGTSSPEGSKPVADHPTPPPEEPTQSSSPTDPATLARLTFAWIERTLVATLTGELDRSNCDEMYESLHRSAANSESLTLDLTGLTYLDSSSLSMIHLLLAGPIPLLVVAPKGSRARRLLEIAAMDTIVALKDSIALN